MPENPYQPPQERIEREPTSPSIIKMRLVVAFLCFFVAFLWIAHATTVFVLWHYVTMESPEPIGPRREVGEAGLLCLGFSTLGAIVSGLCGVAVIRRSERTGS